VADALADDEPYYMKPYSEWTTEQLNSLEERLYDDECAGFDTWFERDKVLIELNRRDFK
jgi:hypothetical protein